MVGDTETITAFGTTSAGGVVKLTNGDLTYSALSSGLLSHIPANGSVIDTFSYTVTDEVGDKATGTVKLTVSNPAVVINGPPKGSMIINGGTQTNIVNSTKTGNTIIEGGGNDIVNVTAGSANVSTGSGDVVVNLSGQNTTVTGGNGNDTVNVLTGSSNNNVTLGTGTDSIVEAATSKGSNTFILNGSNASLLLYGANDVAFIHGGTDTITDDSKGLEVKIGTQGGNITLSNFLADKTGFVDLVGGVGGYKTAKAVVAALQSDGHGGTMLSTWYRRSYRLRQYRHGFVDGFSLRDRVKRDCEPILPIQHGVTLGLTRLPCFCREIAINERDFPTTLVTPSTAGAHPT